MSRLANTKTAKRAKTAGKRAGGAPSDRPAQIGIDYVALSEIRRWPRNPKDHDGPGIRASMDRFGFVTPLQRDDATGELVAGHGRVDELSAMKADGKAAPERIVVRGDGEWLVPVVSGVRFANSAEAHAYAVADNRLTEIGGWSAGLAAVLSELKVECPQGLAGVGYSEADLEELLADLAASQPEPPGDPDAVPEVPAKPVSRRGDLWLCGEHRVECGPEDFDGCDVIIRRWQEYTGREATLDGDGRTFEQVRAERSKKTRRRKASN